MFGFLAVLVYLAAIGIPVFLLYRFHAQSWWWHCSPWRGPSGSDLRPLRPPGRRQATTWHSGLCLFCCWSGVWPGWCFCGPTAMDRKSTRRPLRARTQAGRPGPRLQCGLMPSRAPIRNWLEYALALVVVKSLEWAPDAAGVPAGAGLCAAARCGHSPPPPRGPAQPGNGAAG